MNAILLAAALSALIHPSQTDRVEMTHTSSIVVFDNGAFDGEPLRAASRSAISRDAARADAFAIAENACDGDIRQMGFDSRPEGDSFEAEVFYQCRAR